MTSSVSTNYELLEQRFREIEKIDKPIKFQEQRIKKKDNKRIKIKNKNKKIKLYIDIDDTIINTAETFINKYCKENNIDKDINDLKDYKFKSIDRNIKIEEFLNYIETEEFFNTVKIDEEFLKFYLEHIEDYDWIFITKGTKKNLELKEKYIRERLENSEKIKYIGLHNDLNKSIVNMKDGIQIDNVYDELKSNARYKILIKNYIETDYNYIKDIRDDLYEMNNWIEIAESIEWFRKEISGIVKV